ncbi:hypothetical protein RJ55_01615 [Drechmeria coniospora]|nr:hypothetical protein RJ55_01615 [Drechmeria coniospora]
MIRNWVSPRLLPGAAAAVVLLLLYYFGHSSFDLFEYDRSQGHAESSAPVSHSSLHLGHRPAQTSKKASSAFSDRPKPHDLPKVMGLVFFGRRQTVSILDCYLKRNLVKNGGWLDGVIWLKHTADATDLAFLDKVVESEADYVAQDVQNLDQDGYSNAYDEIKDDIFWVHTNLGAVRPYLPELDREYPTAEDGNGTDWRPSHLPAWGGNFKDPKIENNWNTAHQKKHRWLPVTSPSSDGSDPLDKTPISQIQYDPWGVSWFMWQIGAQQHYSLHEHLEKNELQQYRFRTWDFQFKRASIQFIAMMGRDINAVKPIQGVDEQYFTVDMPKKLGRHAVADGGGVVAHFSYVTQVNPAENGGMKSTDILDRYRSYAQENICTGPMLWTPEEGE